MILLKEDDIKYELLELDLNDKKVLRDLYVLSNKMEFFCNSYKLASLSAIQLGFQYNFFIYKKNNKYRRMLNCKFKNLSNETFDSIEACGSLLDDNKIFRRFKLKRFTEINVTGQEMNDDISLLVIDENHSKNIDCVIIQHELDHLLGNKISQKGKEIHIFERINNDIK